jgi:hypothetical protein
MQFEGPDFPSDDVKGPHAPNEEGGGILQLCFLSPLGLP